MDALSSNAPTDADGIRRDIVRVCRRLYDAGLVAGQDGNVSARLGEDVIVVTPSGMSKVDIGVEDLVEVSASGEKLSGTGRASSELDMHLRIYRHRADVGAVVHAHPPVATGFGVAGYDFMDDVLPETIFHLGPVPLVPYATPGTRELGDSMEPYLAAHDAFLLANHGATTVGATVTLAHQRMESLEHSARILLTARSLGRVNALLPHQGDVLREARRQSLESSSFTRDAKEDQ